MSLIRIFEIPAPTGNYHFGGGEPQTFVEVDWFRDESGAIDLGTSRGQGIATKFIKGKNYYNPDNSYLVLHPKHSFTINYDPDEMIRIRNDRRREP